MAGESDKAESGAPAAWAQSNMRPTMNGTGFMFEVLDEFADDFIQYAGSIDAPVLEVGCAYGVASLPALAGGVLLALTTLPPANAAEGFVAGAYCPLPPAGEVPSYRTASGRKWNMTLG